MGFKQEYQAAYPGVIHRGFTIKASRCPGGWIYSALRQGAKNALTETVQKYTVYPVD